MMPPVFRRPPSVQVERQVPTGGGRHVSDIFTGTALAITVDGPVLTIETQDANGVRFIVTVTQP